MWFSLSLLYAFVCITISGLPASAGSAPELTADTFANTIERGLWFIEYYSPYCFHCKNFKPTWEQLVAEAAKEIPQVKMATVDCVTQADLCHKNGVGAYPTMLMYEDSRRVEEFRESRDLELLKNFMKKHVKVEEKTKVVEAAKPAPKPAPKPSLNLQGDVLPLTSDTFSAVLSKGPAFVKFYAPWCGHCKKLAPTWKQLAWHMQGKVTIAEVNCDEHPSLCKSHGVHGYPSLIWFSQGDEAAGRSDYSGGRKLEQLKSFVDKASAAGVEVLENDGDLDPHIAKEDVVYLLLHQSNDQTILQSVRDAAAPLLGSPPVFASSSSGLFNRFSVPTSTPWAVIAIKDNDASIPSSIFYGSASAFSDSNLRQWLLSHRIPTVLELTQDTFQKVMNAPQSPLVVIVASEGAEKEKAEQRLRDVAKKWRVRTEGSGVVHGRDVVWTVMDRARWAAWLKSMYGIAKSSGGEGNGENGGLDGLKVIIADHSKLVYYDTDRLGHPIKFMSSSSLFSAVEDAASGKTSYKHSENFIERLARNLNGKLQSVEAYLLLHPIRSVFFALAFIAGVLFVLFRFVGSPSAEDLKDSRQKNARLD